MPPAAGKARRGLLAEGQVGGDYSATGAGDQGSRCSAARTRRTSAVVIPATSISSWTTCACQTMTPYPYSKRAPL